MVDFGPEVRRILRANDCELLRKGRGDHEIWTSPNSEKPFTVDGKIKSRHTANAIMKQAGIPKKF